MANIAVPIVSGGVEVLPNEFPWQAYIEIEKDDYADGVHICGGVLVDSDVVLTAAHCVTGVNILHRVLWERGSDGHWTMMWSSQRQTVLQG